MIGRGESGQAVLEGVFATLTLGTFAACALTAAYLCFARIWIEYQLDQTVICFATTGESQRCIRHLQERADKFLVFGKWRATGVAAKSQFSVTGHFEVFGKVNWQWQKNLNVERLAIKARSRGSRPLGFPSSSL